MEGGVVGTEDAAVEVGILFGLDLHAARVGVGSDYHLQVVFLLLEIGRDIEFAPLEGSLDVAHTGAVEPYLGFPVDAVKVQEHALALHLIGQVKVAVIDKVPVKERLRCHHQIIVMVHVGQCPGIDITRQDGRGHGGGNRWGVGVGGAFQPPVAAIEQPSPFFPTGLLVVLGGQTTGSPHLNLFQAVGPVSALHVHSHVARLRILDAKRRQTVFGFVRH